MQSRAAISDGFAARRLCVGVDVRNQQSVSADRSRSRWAVSAPEFIRGGLLRLPHPYGRLLKAGFREPDRFQRNALLLVSMHYNDEAEITAAQELADGSIFFSFGHSPPTPDSGNMDHVTLSPSKHDLVARIHLPNRWPSQFKRQLPFPVQRGVRMVSDVTSSQESTRSNNGGIMECNNQNEIPEREAKDKETTSHSPDSGILSQGANHHHPPTRLQSNFVRISPIPSAVGLNFKSHHTPIRLRSNFVRQLPMPSTVGSKMESHYSPIRLRSKFVRMSPIPSSVKSEKEPRHHAPIRLRSKFVRMSPLPKAMKLNDVQLCDKKVLEIKDCDGQLQLAAHWKERPNFAVAKNPAKGAVKSSKQGNRTMMHDSENHTSSNYSTSLKNVKLGRSRGPITRSPSDAGESHHDYSRYTVPELKMLAKSLNLKGYSTKRRQELLDLLQSAKQ